MFWCCIDSDCSSFTSGKSKSIKSITTRYILYLPINNLLGGCNCIIKANHVQRVTQTRHLCSYQYCKQSGQIHGRYGQLANMVSVITEDCRWLYRYSCNKFVIIETTGITMTKHQITCFALGGIWQRIFELNIFTLPQTQSTIQKLGKVL